MYAAPALLLHQLTDVSGGGLVCVPGPGCWVWLAINFSIFIFLGINFLLGLIFYFPAMLILGQGRTLVHRGILRTTGLPLSHRKVSSPGAQVGKPFTQVSRMIDWEVLLWEQRLVAAGVNTTCCCQLILWNKVIVQWSGCFFGKSSLLVALQTLWIWRIVSTYSYNSIYNQVKLVSSSVKAVNDGLLQ